MLAKIASAKVLIFVLALAVREIETSNCHALSSCDMCGRLPFSTEYKSGVSGPQGAGAALSVLWVGLLALYLFVFCGIQLYPCAI